MKKSLGIFIFAFFIVTTLIWVFANQVMPGPKVLLILSHYDDETMIAATLMKLKHLNADIRSIYLTKGEGGKDIRVKDASYFASEQKRVHALIVAREIDIHKSSAILGAKYYQIELPDVPLRIPEPGYPNPLGRPTTNVDEFLKAGIWDLNDAENKIQKLLTDLSWQPDFIFTTGNDRGVIHSHHQATYLITKRLVDKGIFGPQLQGVYAILETQHYPLRNFPFKNEIFLLDHSEKISKFEETTYIELGYELYLAHQSQPTSQKSLQELREIPECIYLVDTLKLKNNFDGLQKILKTHYKKISFQSNESWQSFFEKEENWKIRKTIL